MSQLVLIQQSIFVPFALDYGASFKKHSNELTQREVTDLLSTRQKTAAGPRARSLSKQAMEGKRPMGFILLRYHLEMSKIIIIKNAVLAVACGIWSNAGKILNEYIMLKGWWLVPDVTLGDRRNYSLNN